ncbi:MAG TPA: LysM domain-containing protein, partial [Ilumatobacteraceae bacterium]
VRPGDGFLAIAKRVWWSATLDDAAAIAKANGLTLESAITPGQVLEVPDCRCTQVVDGDDWKTVAERIGVDVDQLREANVWQGDVLRAGMLIYGGRTPVAPV